jgi:hypothetical protein
MVCFLLIMCFGGISILIGKLPQSLPGAFICFCAGLIVTLILASPIEWIVHRHIYHSRRRILSRIYAIHMAHHMFPESRYVMRSRASRLSGPDSNPNMLPPSKFEKRFTFLVHLLFYLSLGSVLIWLPAWLLSSIWSYVAGIVVATVALSILFITVHDAIHRPGEHPLLASTTWYAFLNEHHHIHHVNAAVNLNSLLPLADWAFRTLTSSIDDEIAENRFQLRDHSKVENVQIKVQQKAVAIEVYPVATETRSEYSRPLVKQQLNNLSVVRPSYPTT